MPNKFKSSWWSIEVVSGWFAEPDAECVSFWREDGVGALQVSALKHDSRTVTDDDLCDSLKDEFPDSAVLKELRCGDFVGVGVNYIVENKFWRKYWLRHGPLLLCITYNSDVEDQDMEKEAVDEMLSSLKSLIEI